MRQRERTSTRSRGFTLMELMVVVIILGILAATIIPQFVGTTQEAKISKARTDISILEQSLERFYIDMDRYPTAQEGLKALVAPPADLSKKWRAAYVKEVLPDPWGNEYAYRQPGLHGSKTFDLWSRGADGTDGGEGPNADIKNWKD